MKGLQKRSYKPIFCAFMFVQENYVHFLTTDLSEHKKYLALNYFNMYEWKWKYKFTKIQYTFGIFNIFHSFNWQSPMICSL